MSDVFLTLKDGTSINTEKIKLNDIVVYDTFGNETEMQYFPVVALLWRQILERNKVTETTFIELDNLWRKYAKLIIERTELIEHEYKLLYKAVKYKFTGVLTVNAELLVEVGVVMAASVMHQIASLLGIHLPLEH
jgi:hypothetical protein